MVICHWGDSANLRIVPCTKFSAGGYGRISNSPTAHTPRTLAVKQQCMEDRFHINTYSAGGLIVMSIGQILSSILDNPSGMIISILGFAGFVIFSKPDKFLALSIIIWAIGIQFVISHWPGGRWIILVGGLIFFISLYLRFKQDNFKNYKLWIFISLIVLFISYYIKLQHFENFELNWYGFMLGALSLIISYGLRFLKKKPKVIEDWLKLLFIYSLTFYYLIKVGHLPGYNLFGFILILSTLCLGGYVFIKGILAKNELRSYD